MSLSWLCRGVNKYFPVAGGKSHRIERRPWRTQVGLEILEDRQLLSIVGPLPVEQLSATALHVTGFPSAEVSGQPHSLTVTAVGSSGKTATNFQGTVHFSSSDPNAGLPADYTFTAADHGRHTFSSVKLIDLGSQSLTATDTADTAITGTESGINVVSPAARLTISDMPATVTAGQPLQITVIADQRSGATDTLFPDTIHFSSTDKKAVLPANYTFTPEDKGSHTFTVTLETAGLHAITVSDSTRPAIYKARAATHVAPGAAVTLRVTGFPTADVSGVAHAMKVEAFDAYGNKAAGYLGTIHITSSDFEATPMLPQNYTFTAADKGIHTFHSVKLIGVGSQSVTATDTADSTIAGTESGIKVDPLLAISPMTAPATAGQPFQITVTACDSLGNTDTLFPDTIHFSSSDKQAFLPANYTFTPEDKGSHTFTVTLGTAGSQAISVRDVSQHIIPLASAGISVQAGPATTLALHLPPSGFAGFFQSATVTAYDAYGNRATSYQDTVHFSSSDKKAGLPANYTFTAADRGSHVFAVSFGTPGQESLDVGDVNNPTVAGIPQTISIAVVPTSIGGSSSTSSSGSSTSTGNSSPAPAWLAAVPSDMQAEVRKALENGLIPQWVQQVLREQYYQTLEQHTSGPDPVMVTLAGGAQVPAYWFLPSQPFGTGTIPGTYTTPAQDAMFNNMLFPVRVIQSSTGGSEVVAESNWMFSVGNDPEGGLEAFPNPDLARLLNQNANSDQLGAALQHDFWNWIINDSSHTVTQIPEGAYVESVAVSPQLTRLYLSLPTFALWTGGGDDDGEGNGHS
jgi:hypothetical protein